MDNFDGTDPSAPRLDNQQPVNPQPQPASTAFDITVPSAPQPQAVVPDMPQVAPSTPQWQQQAMAQPSNIPTLTEADPQVPVSDSSDSKMKMILLIVGGIVIVLGLAAGGYFVGFSAGKTKGQNQAAAEFQKQIAAQQQAASENNSQNTDIQAKLKLDNLVDPEYKDETVSGDVGKQAAASDGFVLKVTNIERNYQSTDPNYKLDPSKELVKVNFLMGNQAKDKPKDINSFSFRLENSSGTQLVPENIASYDGKFDTVTLKSGTQAKGSIVYAVNKNEVPLKFIREQRYRITGENREVTEQVVFVVAK